MQKWQGEFILRMKNCTDKDMGSGEQVLFGKERATQEHEVPLWVLLLFRSGKNNWLGGDCRWKYTHGSQEKGACHTTGTTQGRLRSGIRENMGKRFYCDFWGKKWARQDEQVWDWQIWIISEGLGHRDHSQLFGIWPWGVLDRGIVVLLWESSRGDGGDVGSELIALPLKGTLSG